MKITIVKSLKRNWIMALAIQSLESLALGFLVSLAMGLPLLASGVALWLLLPCLGALTAFQAVRRGLLNYAAWLAPPIGLYVAHFALWHYSPPAGPALLCAFVALIGAASGEVWRQRQR